MFMRRQQGFGLVELLVGMGIAMIILAAASTAFLSSLTSNRDSIRMARLDSELRQVMTMISRDLRRASAWDPAVDVARVSLRIPLTLSSNAAGTGKIVSTSSSNDAGIDHLADIGQKAIGGTLVYIYTDAADLDGDTDTSETFTFTGTITAYNNGQYTVTLNQTSGFDWPSSVTSTDGVPAGAWSILRPGTAVTTDAVAGTPGKCLMFNYDIDTSSTSGSYAGTEYYGYRYDDDIDGDNAVEIRTSGTAAETCTGTWANKENLTDDASIEITSFSVATSPATVTSSGLTVTVRDFTVSITGRLRSDNNIQRTLQETIRVRNDGLT
jgi:Tfp pilus assembly protein PilW